jgi:hypothetical protein
MCASLE